MENVKKSWQRENWLAGYRERLGLTVRALGSRLQIAVLGSARQSPALVFGIHLGERRASRLGISDVHAL
jgi:hypothetical protein